MDSINQTSRTASPSTSNSFMQRLATVGNSVRGRILGTSLVALAANACTAPGGTPDDTVTAQPMRLDAGKEGTGMELYMNMYDPGSIVEDKDGVITGDPIDCWYGGDAITRSEAQSMVNDAKADENNGINNPLGRINLDPKATHYIINPTLVDGSDEACPELPQPTYEGIGEVTSERTITNYGDGIVSNYQGNDADTYVKIMQKTSHLPGVCVRNPETPISFCDGDDTPGTTPDPAPSELCHAPVEEDDPDTPEFDERHLIGNESFRIDNGRPEHTPWKELGFPYTFKFEDGGEMEACRPMTEKESQDLVIEEGLIANFQGKPVCKAQDGDMPLDCVDPKTLPQDNANGDFRYAVNYTAKYKLAKLGMKGYIANRIGDEGENE